MQKFSYSEMKRKFGNGHQEDAYEETSSDKQTVQGEISDNETKESVIDSSSEQATSDVQSESKSEDAVQKNEKKEVQSIRSPVNSDIDAFKSSALDVDNIAVYEPDPDGSDIQINESYDNRKQEVSENLQQEDAATKSSKKRVKKSVSNSDVAMSVIKKFPSDLARHIKSLFPTATTMDEALTAYVYMKEGEPPDILVPDNIQTIIASYIGDIVTPKDVQEELMKELLKIREMNNKTMRKLNSIELAIAYELFDRAGFRKEPISALSPGELNFLGAGISDLIKQLEKQAELKQNRDNQRAGRPIK